MKHLVWALVAALGFAQPLSAEPVSPTQALRQVTLDLYQRLPTDAELDAAEQGGDPTLDPALLEALVASPETEAFLRRYHADLLWPAFNPFSLVSFFAAGLLPAMYAEYGGDPTRYFLYATSLYRRGALVPCKDEPATFDASGYPVLEPWPDGTLRDGWVWVEPYWAPGTQVKVCALEARALTATAGGLPCDTFGGMVSGECGCGDKLYRCASPEVVLDIEASLREQILRAAVRPIRDGAPYFDFLTESTEEVNGPLVHYYRYLAPMAVEPLVLEAPVAPSALPDLDYGDADTWARVPRGPEHSGVLTQLLFLLRFQTARARAARYYEAFLCSPFVAPEGGLPSPSDPCTLEPNLRERCGCASCHVSLEPAAAHWGRFSEAGTLYLDPGVFPDFRASCAVCGQYGSCDFSCERFYFTRAGHPDEEPFLGRLRSHVFAEPTDLAVMSVGPRALVDKTLASGQLERCTVSRLFARLMGRPLSAQERLRDLPGWVAGFRDSGHRFDALLLTLLSDARYGRLER